MSALRRGGCWRRCRRHRRRRWRTSGRRPPPPPSLSSLLPLPCPEEEVAVLRQKQPVMDRAKDGSVERGGKRPLPPPPSLLHSPPKGSNRWPLWPTSSSSSSSSSREIRPKKKEPSLPPTALREGRKDGGGVSYPPPHDPSSSVAIGRGNAGNAGEDATEGRGREGGAILQGVGGAF